MAESPAHRFGQVVGNLLEEILLPELLGFCEGRDLYVDRHGSRVSVRKGKKVSWEDKYGNSHDLDFVIEKGGSHDRLGRPIAFIEAAWRRYSKHSRAKAQEIQGAVLPIAEKYDLESPFLGAVLAGIFTQPSLDQLRSLGFTIVFLPYETIMAAFDSVGIDARFDESTPQIDFRRCVDAIDRMTVAMRTRVKEHILSSNRSGFNEFLDKIRTKLARSPDRITIMPLFGKPIYFSTKSEAFDFLSDFDRNSGSGDFQRLEIDVLFSNKDEIKGIFHEEEEAVRFLKYVTS